MTLGTLAAAEVSSLTGGLMAPGRAGAVERAARARRSTTTSSSSAPSCRTRSPGFAGGAKYFFPGVAGPELTHLTHWLGALATIERVIGRVETPTRRVIEAAADRVTTPVIAFTSVSTRDASRAAARTRSSPAACARRCARRPRSARRCTSATPGRRYRRVIALLDEHYDEMWVGGKASYKLGGIIEDGGELVIYAPHLQGHFDDARPADREVRLRAARSGPRDGRRLRRAARQPVRGRAPRARQLRQPRSAPTARIAPRYRITLASAIPRRRLPPREARLPDARRRSTSRRRAAIPTRSSSSTPGATCTSLSANP